MFKTVMRFLPGLFLAGLPLGLQAQDAVPVQYQRPLPAEQAEPLRLNGTVRSPNTAALSTEVAGLVQTVPVDAGSRVEKGDLLLQLDAELVQLELAAAEAAVAEALSLRNDARRLRDEGAPLAKSGTLPASEQRSRETAAEGAEAALRRSRLSRDAARARLQKHSLRAPFAGVVRQRHVAPGAWVNTGTAVLELVAVEGLVLDVQVPQAALSLLAERTPLVRMDGDPEPVLADKPLRVPVIDERSRTFLVRIPLPNPDGRVLPGMSAEAALPLAQARQALAIPRDATLRYPDGSRVVWVLEGPDAKATVRRQAVEVRAERGEQLLVGAGLAAEDRIVVRGNERLREGQSVRATALPTGAGS
ncbi:MAG: efflux RND transporter periplasmic adaptor subunit [Oceanococcaceae bacterium]